MQDDEYAVVANPSGVSGHYNQMQANPGVFLRRDELPAEQHATGTVIAGSLVALAFGVGGALALEYGIAALPRLRTAFRVGIEFTGIVAGIWVAKTYPVIGAAVIGAVGYAAATRILNEWATGPSELEARRDAAAPSAGLEAGGVYTPYPTGAFAAVG